MGAPAELFGILDARSKDLSPMAYSYKLSTGQFAVDVPMEHAADIDERRMSVWINFADGNRRDGGGDLTEVAGIVTERHQKNPICLFNHAKEIVLPIGLAEDPDTKAYTVSIDPATRTAKGNVFFYQGFKPLTDGIGQIVPGQAPEDQHGVFCEQLFHLIAQGVVRAGSFAYSIIQAVRLQPEFETGTPGGLHLLKTLLLEFGPTVLPMSSDTVRKMKEFPVICGKKLHPVLVKSFGQFAVENTKTITGYEKALPDKVAIQEASHVLETNPTIPPAKRKPGVGTVKKLGDNEHSRKVPYLQSAGLASPSLPTTGRWQQDTGIVGGRTKELRKKYKKKSMKTETKSGTDHWVTINGAHVQVDGQGKVEKGPEILKGKKPKKTTKQKKRNIKKADTELQKHGYRIEGVDDYDLSSKTAYYKVKHPNGEIHKMSVEDIEKIIDSKSFAGQINTKSMDVLRKKYRDTKSCRMRRKKSMPGSSFIYVDRKSTKAVQNIATAKGLKFEYVGPAKSMPTADKIRLTGDDNVIDEIAREHGKSIRRGFKSMTTKKVKLTAKSIKPGKVGKKSMQEEEEAKDIEKVDDGTEVEVGGEETAETPEVNEEVEAPETTEEGSPEETAPEKYSAQVLRTMHKDAQILMQQYDEMLGPLEHEDVSKLLLKKLEALESDLTDIESLFSEAHSDLPELEGTGADDKGMAEEEVEDENTGDGVEEADSKQEELPDAYEAVEGMDKNKTKALRNKYTKSMKCEKCGEVNCKCAGVKSVDPPKVPGEEENQEKPGEVTDNLSESLEQTPGNEENQSFQPHEKKIIGESSGYLSEQSKEQNFSDEHRMKAYHWHKSLEPLHAQPEQGTDPAMEPSNEEYQQKSANAAGAPVAQPTNNEHGALSEHRSTIAKASMFLKALSAERAFGDAHRQEADWHAKALNPIAMEAEAEGVQEGHAPGEMGEKDMDEDATDGEKSLFNVFSTQGSAIAQLTKTLEALQNSVAR